MRKRVESGATDPITRVLSQTAPETPQRINAHRLAIGQASWESSREKRLTALQKRLLQPPAPIDPATRRPLQLPVYVTRYRSSVRQWPAIRQLLEEINQWLAPAQIVLQLSEPGECNRSVNSRHCPFEEDIDHNYEWIHLATVSKLPEDRPMVMSCGRCCLVPDRADGLHVARAICQLLGQEIPEGEGLELCEEHIQWMRWEVWLLQGQPVPLPLLTLGVWGYGLVASGSQRKAHQLRSLLEEANQYWLQAGIAWELLGWTQLQASDYPGHQLDEAWLQEHLPGLKWPYCQGLCLKDPEADWKVRSQAEALWFCLEDRFERTDARQLAHHLGKLLGLSDALGKDQLLCPFSHQGNRLSALEISRARRASGQQVDRSPLEVRCQLQTQLLKPAPSEAETLPIPLRVTLVRGPQHQAHLSLQEARRVLDLVASIWAQAGLELKIALDEGHFADWNRSTLIGHPGYQGKDLHLFWLHQIPVEGKPGMVQPYLHSAASHLVLLAESYAGLNPEKNFCLALASCWGLKAQTTLPFPRLLNHRSAGLELAPEEIDKVREHLGRPRRPASPSTAPVLRIPVHLYAPPHLLEVQARNCLQRLQPFWAPAELLWETVAFEHLPPDTTPQGLPGYRQDRVHLWLDPEASPQVSRPQRLIRSGLELAPNLVTFLNLKIAAGTALNPQEAQRARTQATSLLEALAESSPREPAPMSPLKLSLSVCWIESPGYRSGLTEEAFELALHQAQTLFQSAALELVVRHQSRLALNDEVVRSALPNEQGQSQRKASFAGLTGHPSYRPGLLNLYWVSQLTSFQGSQRLSWIQDKPGRILILKDPESPAHCGQSLIRGLLSFLDLPPGEFVLPQSVRSLPVPGNRLLDGEIERIRDQVKRLFPFITLAAFQPPR